MKKMIKFKALREITPLDMESMGFVHIPNIKEHLYSYTIKNFDGIIIMYVEYAIGDDYITIYNNSHEEVYKVASFLLVEKIINIFNVYDNLSK